METKRYTKGIGLSLVAAMLLGSSAYAGLIKTDADTLGWEANKQYGFGGWNLDNVLVKIVSIEDYSTALSGTLFDETSGTYSEMTYDMSFESEISTEGEVRGLLHGKDWPVGEPSGIKIINGDTNVNNGKPENCIMTTSYLSADDTDTGLSGYLDTEFTPVPTKCSSPFQTHKRFKINMQPTTVADYDTTTGYGKPIDLVFNLDPDSNNSMQRYQVFSKINNYTDARLDGYKIEVLDANGDENTALTLSLGIGENCKVNKEINVTVCTNIWDTEDMANFSHGLWGPQTYEEPPHFPTDGFFDKIRAYLPVSLNDSNNTTETTHGAIQGGNYDALFGHWLPSKWQPYGIFFDDDGDATTDAKLVAFWGTVPTDPAGAAPDWHKGNDYTDGDDVEAWELVTEADLEAWNLGVEGSLYTIGKIEDTLNLGLNYIVEVGDNTTDQIGDTFIIRITPNVSKDQTPPSYINATGDYILPPQLIVPDEEPVAPVVSSSSNGGSCTFNPNSKGVDMTVLLMLAAGLLYPFRRRFIK